MSPALRPHEEENETEDSADGGQYYELLFRCAHCERVIERDAAVFRGCDATYCSAACRAGKPVRRLREQERIEDSRGSGQPPSPRAYSEVCSDYFKPISKPMSRRCSGSSLSTLSSLSEAKEDRKLEEEYFKVGDTEALGTLEGKENTEVGEQHFVAEAEATSAPTTPVLVKGGKGGGVLRAIGDFFSRNFGGVDDGDERAAVPQDDAFIFNYGYDMTSLGAHGLMGL